MARRRSVSSMAFLHRVGHDVGVENRPAIQVAGAAADGLDQRSGRAQEAFFVGIENRHQRNFRQVQALAQQVDADQHVELAAAQIAQNLHALERLDLGVQVAALHADFGVILGQIFGHALGQRGHQHALAACHALANFVQQVVHLALDRPHFDWRIDQARGPNDLLDHHARRLGQLVRPRRGRDVDHLIHAVLEFFERQRTVVERAGQAESVLDQRFLARAVAVIHAVQLRNGLVRFVDEHQGVVRQVIEQRRRRLARQASGEMARIILDAVAVADLP